MLFRMIETVKKDWKTSGLCAMARQFMRVYSETSGCQEIQVPDVKKTATQISKFNCVAIFLLKTITGSSQFFRVPLYLQRRHSINKGQKEYCLNRC